MSKNDKTQVEVDDGNVDLDFEENEGAEVEVEVEASTTEDVSVEAKESDGDGGGEGDEHQEYSTSVKKRIDRLTKKMREAERQKDEAFRFAQTVKEESDQVRARLKTVDQGYMTEYGSRLDMEQQQVEQDLKRAVETGDSDATVVAQRQLTQLAVAADRYQQAKRQQTSAQEQEQAQTAQQAHAQQVAPPVQQKRPDQKAEKWATDNDWFGKDEAMTFAAFGLHKKLVENEGFDPTTDEYYSELDTLIRKEFPQKFQGNTGRRPAQNVAGGSRSTGSGRSRQVKLTPSQVSIAKKLGVPLQEYAKYVK